MGTNSAPASSAIGFCTECGRPYPPDDLVRFGNSFVCVECKPRFVQRMREGVAGPSTIVYGGFWRRFLAVLLDSLFIAIVNFPLQIVLGLAGFKNTQASGPNFGLIGLIYLINFALQCAYFTYFWSRRGATPGQMILGLKVVTAEGGPLTTGRAFGRYWAYILSAFTLCIGYIIAAFDSQKRALHDYICGTRVIHTTL